MVSNGRRVVLCVVLWFVIEEKLIYILARNCRSNVARPGAVVWCRVAFNGCCVVLKGRRVVSCGVVWCRVVSCGI